MSFRKALIWVVCFQMVFGNVTYAYDGDDGPDFDFSDEPFVVTPGEDRHEGRSDGNCAGSGCGERVGRGERNDDRDDDGSDRGDGGRGGRDRDDSRGDRGGQSQRDWLPYGVPNKKDRVFKVAPRQIATKDFHADGMVFLKDTQGLLYFRGEYDGEYTDHRDIYFNRKGVPYVKSVDGKHLLNIDALKDCSDSDTCVASGFRADWWNYSMKPELETGLELDEWDQNISYHKDQLEIKRAAIASREKGVQPGSAKDVILNEVEFLASEARLAFLKGQMYEAFSFQDGAHELLKGVADIGIGLSPAGWAKDVYEVISGKSLIDGRMLSTTERLFAGIGAISPALGPLGYAGMRMVSRSGRVASEANFFGKLGRLVEKAQLKIPRGTAIQEFSVEALKIKAAIISEDRQIFRVGTRGINQTGGNAQFWAPKHPGTPGFGSRYGIPKANLEKMDFVEVGRVKPGTSFVTRKAPGVGGNPGGEIEVVVPEGSVIIDGHYSL